MKYRFVGSQLALAVVVSVAACGSSKSKTSPSTATTPAAITATTPAATTAATQSTATPATGPTAAVCAEATKDLQPLEAAATQNNTGQLMAQAGQAASKMITLQSRPGISSQAHAALGELTGALEAFAHGAQATSKELVSAGEKFAAACR